ncbi:OmpA family protein [Maribacter algarum]|uniref:OmpA family protein n=1 Tax=Maribacter algarum (ex Zhang et al. 2020) TaxID=2578118 RepID=A0A5S3PE41_9FLAO|nr:OmpA family protein [Maribacter algarum]TMM52226.1 OmpA family protein [Maribacter algarum]
MKNSFPIIKLIFSIFFMFAFSSTANGQLLKKLGKRAEKAAERAIERRVEKETQEKTDEVLDSILEPGKKGKQKKSPIPEGENSSGTNKTEPNSNPDGNTEESDIPESSESSEPKTIQVYSKFDFVPGDKLLFFDDFSDDFIGDFPSKWNTNGSGELVTINESSTKWLKILPGFGTQYIPDVAELPEEFTMEFDVVTKGLNSKTSSQAYLQIMVGDTKTFQKPQNYGFVEYPFCQFIDPGIIIENNINGKREIRNDVRVDIKDIVLSKHHISLAVNKQRFRIWINEQKLVDVPRLLPVNTKMEGIKIQLRGIDTNVEAVYLSNFKIAEGGIDLRRKLIAYGKISTNGILFDSGSANIQAQSMGIIRQIYQVLAQEKGMKLKIVGHTDSDGDKDTNLDLSKKRADAVKKALVSIYSVSAERLFADGKGESEPIGDNTTVNGKAQNRRVEFIKQN